MPEHFTFLDLPFPGAEEPVPRNDTPVFRRLVALPSSASHEEHPDAAYAEPPLDAIAQADWDAAKKRLGDALPDDGWLAEYVRTHLPLTDAPAEFHVAAGLALVSTALGNRVGRNHRGSLIFPHTWNIIVAPSTKWHKSHAITLSQRVREAALPGTSLPSSFSSEGFITALAGKPAGIVTFDEFGGFLAMASRDYNAQLKSLMMTLYNSGPDEPHRQTQGGGEVVCRWPAVTIIAATTVENLTGLIERRDLSTGILARFGIITATEKGTDRPDTEEGFRAPRLAVNRLVRGLARLRALGPQTPPVQGQDWQPALVRFTPESLAAMNEWRAGPWTDLTEAAHRTAGFDTVAFAERLSTALIKYAIQFRAAAAALDGSADPLLIDTTAVRAASALVERQFAWAIKVYDEQVAFDAEQRSTVAVRNLVADRRTRSEIMRRSHLSARKFQDALNTLLEREEVTQDSVEGERGRVTRWLQPGPSHPVYDAWVHAAERRADLHRAAAPAAPSTPAALARQDPSLPGRAA